MDKTTSTQLSYQDAGVNIDAGNDLVSRIKPIAKRTLRKEVLGGLGGFGALFDLDLQRYSHPILVSSTDGVGTKLKLAMSMNQHDTIGIDLVAMCVNDIIVCGAEPLFFLDYFATGKLDVETAATIIAGIGQGCEQAGAALVGGETAEMPGLYQHNDYDLAGFSVGMVDKPKIIDGSKVAPGNVIIGLASSGPHSNGYSLIRKVLEIKQLDLHMPFGNSTLGSTLLTPTKIYVKSILALLAKQTVLAMAHITGGGFIENIPRVLPTDCEAVINRQSFQMPDIFNFIQQQGNISDHEMARTFNCGIGMILCVPKEEAFDCCQLLQEHGETAMVIEQIRTKTTAEQVVMLP